MLRHGMTLNLISANMCSPAIFETYLSYCADIQIVVANY